MKAKKREQTEVGFGEVITMGTSRKSSFRKQRSVSKPGQLERVGGACKGGREARDQQTGGFWKVQGNHILVCSIKTCAWLWWGGVWRDCRDGALTSINKRPMLKMRSSFHQGQFEFDTLNSAPFVGR